MGSYFRWRVDHRLYTICCDGRCTAETVIPILMTGLKMIEKNPVWAYIFDVEKT